jgi:hypothetical protein
MFITRKSRPFLKERVVNVSIMSERRNLIGLQCIPKFLCLTSNKKDVKSALRYALQGLGAVQEGRME